VATVDGADSTWNNDGELYVGHDGSGTLNISGGGAASVGRSTYVGYEAGSIGSVHFGPGGGTLTTGSLFASPTQLSGTGTINTRGLVSDIDLVFDSTVSLNQTLVFDSQPEQNVTVNLDMAGDPGNSVILGAGWRGHGSLAIRDGVTVNSYGGDIGYASGSTGVATVDGAGSTWTSSYILFVGRRGSGTLNITGGAAVVSRDGFVGGYSGSTGMVTVDGAGSTWANSQSLFIGYFPGSTGVVTVDGSTLAIGHSLYVGRLGDSGTLQISDGGAVSANFSTYVGYSTDSTGLIHFGPGGGTLTTGSLFASPAQFSGTGTVETRGLVSDVDLVLDSTADLDQDLVFDSQPDQNITVHFDMSGDPSNNGELGAGWRGHGSLTVRDGVTVSSSGGYIGHRPGSTGVVTVDGAGSSWTNRSTIYIGRYGSGALNITGGAAVSNKIGYIGSRAGSTGVAIVEGAGSTWINDSTLYVGNYGNGTLNIVVGATVSSRSGVIANVGGSTGVVTVDGAGSKWTNSGKLFIGNSGLATLHITGGGAVSAASVSVYAGSLLAIDIGNDSELAVDGDVVLEPSATLELMLVDTTADGQPEPIEVGGLLDLSAADDAIVPQWQPGPDAASKFGGEYVVAAYGSVDGEFDSVGGGSGPYDIGEAYVAGIDYVTDNRITLSLHPLLDGDADLDGKVWLSDWAALRANFGNMGNGKNWADGNFDPWVDDKVWLSDWAALRANFSNAGYTADGAATVPEPGTIVMLLGAVALALVVGNCKLRAARTMNPSPTPSPPAPLPEGEGSFGSQLCPANHSGVPSRR
ncbi:MAG: hypothetical protein HQ567_21940, partial [Candidatus Nealsonbacteria bacterium]|nr:hypothetical protein [Candidatus Nealsonbacteria bacterium]